MVMMMKPEREHTENSLTMAGLRLIQDHLIKQEEQAADHFEAMHSMYVHT